MTHHELQCFALERFAHMTELYYERDQSWTDAERRLVDHVLYSTYRDCESVGLRPVARAMLAELHGKVA